MLQALAAPDGRPRLTKPLLEHGFQFEQAGMLERALHVYREALSAADGLLDRAQARLRIARVLRALTRWDEALIESRSAVACASEAGADDLAAEAMNVEIGVHAARGSLDDGERLGALALTHAQSPRTRGIILQNLGTIAARRRDFGEADRRFGESVAAFRESGYDLGVAIALVNASAAARDVGEAERALVLGREAAALCRRLNALDVLLTAAENQASALVSLGQLDEAELLLTECLGHFTSAGNRIRQAECLEILGELATVRGHGPDAARRCYARARELAELAGDRVLVERLANRLTGLA